MDNTFYQMYLRELQQISPCSQEEQDSLVAKLLEGDLSVAERLIEGNLFRVLDVIKEFDQTSVPVSDLVQEGNMALTMAVGDYSDGNYGAFVPFIEEEIRRAVKGALEEQGASDSLSKRILEQVELLHSVSETMAEELGREATLPELAERMGMSEDMVRDIMKMALDALSPVQ